MKRKFDCKGLDHATIRPVFLQKGEKCFKFIDRKWLYTVKLRLEGKTIDSNLD